MHWPQVTIIAITALSGGVVAAKNGELREFSFGEWMINTAITMGLLYAGGFFDV